MFDPKTNKFPYPNQTDKHYLVIKKEKKIVFDKDYPYVDKTKSFRFRQSLVRIVLFCVVFLFARIRLGLKIRGKENLKTYKDVIKKGVISVSNHVHMFDYIAIMLAIKPMRPYVLSWKYNITGPSGKLVRLVGGIPIPEDNVSATISYYKSLVNLLDCGGWLHVYAEGSMWEYYQPIRPFKRGASYLACKCDKPILPLAFSYRKPGFIRRKIFGQIACFTLNIGTPQYKDDSLPVANQGQELLERVHDEVCKLAGIDPDKNIYEKIYSNSKRIDYYTDTYGVGYKKSW